MTIYHRFYCREAACNVTVKKCEGDPCSNIDSCVYYQEEATRLSSARKAAAKHSADIISAIHEYANLTNQTEKPVEQLKEEMLSRLPGYRHPCGSPEGEHMIFFDPANSEVAAHATMIQTPLSIIELEKNGGASQEAIELMKRLSQEADMQTIRAAEAEIGRSEAEKKLSAAEEAYRSQQDERSSTRNTAVVRALGLSDGKRPNDFDGKQIYRKYVSLVRKEGLPRIEAVKKVRKTYHLSSEQSVIQILKEQKTRILLEWEEASPPLVPEMRNRLKGLIPSL